MNNFKLKNIDSISYFNDNDSFEFSNKYIRIFVKYYSSKKSIIEIYLPSNIIEKMKIDCSLGFELLNYNIVDELKLLEPYGKANPEPLFGTKNVEIKCISIIGKNKNVIKLVLSQDSIEFSGIIFTNFDKYIAYLNEKFKTNDIISEQNNIKDKFIDILYTPVINEYMNTKSIQLLIKDIR